MKIYRLLLALVCCMSIGALPAQSGKPGKNGRNPSGRTNVRPWQNKQETDKNAPAAGTANAARSGKYKADTNYFQQQVNYTIRVKLDDVNHTLTGYETIEYKNNSPHQLKYIYFHLWANAYKNHDTQLAKQLLENGQRNFYYGPESDRGFIDSLLFKTGNDTLKWEYYKKKNEEEDKDKKAEEYIDVAKVMLKKPLMPDSTIIITTPFFVKIPSGLYSRLGHIRQSYQITQWFPKPAVYDRNGWNPMPYLNQGEFYSEFGNFDVSITLPANYLVAATGDLTGCPDEERMLELKARQTEQQFKNMEVDKLGNLMGSDDFPPSSNEWKTLRFIQKNVHDFAWFADKRWHVLKGEYQFEKGGRLVTLWSFFTTGNSGYWRKSIDYIRDAVHYYSKWNGDYPYNVVTAVDGTISAGGGMEYPTITNIGDVSSALSLETVIMHEVGHNWFYGILGSNERLHPWMDEGLNSANEMRYMATKYPELSLGSSFGLGSGLSAFLGLDSMKQCMSYYLGSRFAMLTNDDQPIEGRAAEYTDANYALMVYYKTATAFNYLRAYLGDKVYDECMHAYFNAWKFRHPQPGDLRKAFETTAGKNLGWFFEDLVTTNGVIDYRLGGKRKPNTKSTKTYGWMVYEEGVEVENKGDLAVPFCIVGITADTVAAVRWYNGFTGREVVAFPNGNYDRIVIDPFHVMPEVNDRNNTLKYKINGKRLLQHMEKPQLKFLAGVDQPGRTMLYYTPVPGFNVEDGFQLGLAVYNSVVFQKPFEYTIMPLYGFKSGKVNGSVSLAAHGNFRQSSFLKSVDYGVDGVSYSTPSVDNSYYLYKYSGRFFRVDPYVTFHLKPKTPRSPLTQRVTFKYYFTGEVTDVEGSGYSRQITDLHHFGDVQYRLSIDKTLLKQQLNVQGRYGYTGGGNFSNVTAAYTVSRVLGKRGRKITARAYAGAFLFNLTNNGLYNLRGDGVRGIYDYTYSQTFIGRYEYRGLSAQQFAEGYANIKTPTAYAQSDKWNAAINLNCDLPLPVFKLFADVGASPFKKYTYDGMGNVTTTETVKVVADAGIYASLLGGLLDIYFPLWVSGDIKNEYEANDISFAERIRFTLNIQPFAPQRIAKTVNLF